MKKYTIIVLLFSVTVLKTFGQSDSPSIYKKLATKKMYSVSLSFHSNNGKPEYKLDGKNVSKETYDKYKSTWSNLQSCCPCLLKYYDKNEILLREIVSCTDCGVGNFKEFYPNGKVKLSGQFKENNSGDWTISTLQQRGFCSIPDGKWTYFDKKGDTLYSEFWKNGEFIKQEPEQKKNEIWKVDLTLNGESIENKKLTFQEVQQLSISPKFKNSSPIKTNFVIKFQVTAIGYRENEKTFSIENFKTINVKEMLSEVGIPLDHPTTFNLTIYNNDKFVAEFYPTIIN